MVISTEAPVRRCSDINSQGNYRKVAGFKTVSFLQ